MNYLRGIRFLLTDDPGAGGGGGGAETDTVESLKAKLAEANDKLIKETNIKEDVIKQRDKLKADIRAAEDADAIEAGRIKELYEKTKAEKDKISAELEEAKTYKEKLLDMEKTTRQELIDQLPEEHKAIASLIPAIDGLRNYVKLNAAKPPAGSDPGRPGGKGKVDYSNTKWDDLTFDDKADLEKNDKVTYARLYKEKYGINP